MPEIVRLGYHDVAINVWYGLQGAPQNWPIKPRHDEKGPTLAIVPIFPSINGSAYGTDDMVGIYKNLECDVLISCQDVWVIPATLSSQVTFAPWVPIDHDPCPEHILTALRPSIYTMCYSQWGVDVLAKSGLEAHYVPCSAPTSIFNQGDKAKARKSLNIPDWADFVVSIVAANKDPDDRKGYGEALQGFAKFLEKHENAVLYVHTYWDGYMNIGEMAKRLGIEKHIAQPPQLQLMLGLLTEQYMRQVYNASDVLLNCAKSEGFGLPILEAQMCGCPVAASAFSTTDELLFAGWKIPGQLNWSKGANSWRLMVYVDAVADALEEAYREKDNEKLHNQAVAGAIKFDDERVAKEYWKPALAEIEKLTNVDSGLKMVTF